MKKVLIIILVLLLAAVGIAGGFWWYRETHIFVEDAVYEKKAESLDLRGQDISAEHYASVHSQLPNCDILWDVPFQGGKQVSDSKVLTVTTLTEADIAMLPYFTKLETVDALGCADYAVLQSLEAQRPDLKVSYQVDLGGVKAQPDAAELTLNQGDYDYDVLTENLQYLPGVQSILFPKTDLDTEALAALAEAYPEIAVDYTVEILGVEYASQTTEMDLSFMTSENVAEVAEKFAMLKNLASVELMDTNGASQLALADVKALKDAAPEVKFNYSFDFYGYKLSTSDESLHIRNKRIGDAGVEQIRQMLDIMNNCSKLVVEYCQISDEAMAQLRDDYRDKTKVVWRVHFGGGSALTDSQVIRTTYDLTDDNSHDLVYCEDVMYMDIGHNEFLDAVDFVAGMPNLEVIIVSGAPIKDLTPFENCKKLRVLEIAFCHYIEDISPLAACESLKMLNIGFTQVTDLSPLDKLELTHLCLDKAKVEDEERERFAELQPDCWITYKDGQPYGQGWRYDEEDKPLPWYTEIGEAFRYPEPPNNAGWYLKK